VNKLLDFILLENDAPHTYSSTQIQLPQDIAKETLKIALAIPDDQIYTDPENPSYGRELDPHITIKYGLKTTRPEDVEGLIEDDIQKFKVRLGKISVFSGEDTDNPYDVIKVDVESEELEKLNALFSTLENGDTHPDYKPHATIAYVKKGYGEDYVGRTDLEGKEFEVSGFKFKGSDDTDTQILLTETLVDHGRIELDRVGLFDEDSDYNGMIGKAVLELLDTFAKQGHSGFSAALTTELFDKLVRFEPLSPITDDPEEWMDVTEYGSPDNPLWQSQRNPACFSTDGGKTHYHVDKPKAITKSEKFRSPLDRKQGGTEE